MLCVLNLPSEGRKGQKKKKITTISIEATPSPSTSKNSEALSPCMLLSLSLSPDIAPKTPTLQDTTTRVRGCGERGMVGNARLKITIYLKICDGGDGGATFQLSELLGAQEHRGQVSPIRLGRGGEMQ